MSVKSVLAIIAVILSILLFVAAAVPSFSAEPKNIPVKGKVTLVDLGAASCIPCKMMAPILDKLAKRYEGKATVVFIDLRYNREAIEQFRVQGIPTQIFFDKPSVASTPHPKRRRAARRTTEWPAIQTR